MWAFENQAEVKASQLNRSEQAAFLMDLNYYTIQVSPHCGLTLNPQRLDYCDEPSTS